MIFFYVAKDHLPRSKINIFKLQEIRIAMTRLRHFLLRQNSTIDNQALARIFRLYRVTYTHCHWGNHATRLFSVHIHTLIAFTQLQLGEIMRLVCLTYISMHGSYIPWRSQRNKSERKMSALHYVTLLQSYITLLQVLNDFGHKWAAIE